MENIDQGFYQALEELSKQYPYEGVNLECKRDPAGVYSYVAHLDGNEKLGLEFTCGWGNSPREACRELVTRAGERNPEPKIKEAIVQHEREIAKLRMALQNLTLPPWKPILQLGVGNPPPPEPEAAPAFINVEARKEEVPF